MYARSHFQCGPKSFQTTIIDRSNEPILVVGDSIIVDPDVAPMPGDFLVLTMKNRDVLIRRYRPREKRIELVPANADWPTVTIKSLSVVQLVGVVTEHCRRLR